MPTLLASDLTALVRDVAADESLWLPQLRFDPAGRWWTRLDIGAPADVWLLSWLPEQTTDLHDHGGATAAFTVLRGTLLEVRTSAAGPTWTHVRRTGDVAVVPPGAVHDVTHTGTVPAVSLHAYAPRLETMTFWEEGPTGLRAVRTVQSDEPEARR